MSTDDQERKERFKRLANEALGVGGIRRADFPHSSRRAPETRFVYGVGCTFWGSIEKVGSNGGLPCCPHCKGMLFEMRSKGEWDDGIARYEKERNDPNYGRFIAYLTYMTILHGCQSLRDNDALLKLRAEFDAISEETLKEFGL